MASRKKPGSEKIRVEVKRLREKARELQETLDAIRSGQVDALVVGGSAGDQIFTLQGAEHPYRVLVESINEGAAIMDVHGVVLYANGRLAELLGIPLEQLIGASTQNHFPPTEWYKLHLLTEQGRRAPASCEVALDDKNDSRHILRLSASPFRESDQELICVIATEVTELIEANKAREKSERELQALSGRLLQIQDDERRRISRDLHDASGQKLAALNLSLSQLARAKALESDLSSQELLTDCRELSEQLGQEIRTLSYLLHPPLLDELGLASPVRWFVDGFARRTGITVDIEIPDELQRLPPEAELALFRVLQESLTNVHRYSGSSTAQVRLRTTGDLMQLEIEDQGQGMPEEALHAGTSVLLGVGIQGMRERMRQLSGRLDIIPGENCGVKVIATIPISRVESESQDNLPLIASVPQDGSHLSGDLRRILIADDHEMIRQGIRGILQEEKGWEICGEAADGKEAVEMTCSLGPDLVILDVNMPVRNGLAALRQIRRLRPQTKVLVFTVNDSNQAQREIMAAGADGYLPKSNASRDLIGALKSILQGTEPVVGAAASAKN